MKTKIFLATILFISICFISNAQEHYAFKVSDWKGNAAPNLMKVKISTKPIVQTLVFTDEKGNLLDGKYHIIENRFKYILADLSKGQINGELKAFTENIETKSFNYKNGILVGTQKDFNDVSVYSNGVIQSKKIYDHYDKLNQEYSYQNGQLMSYVRYDDSGNIIEKKQYLNGQQDGEYFYISSEGKTQKSVYKNGALNGSHLETYANGKTAVSGSYINEKKTGLWIIYDKEGNKLEETEYKDGKYNGKRKLYIKGALSEEAEYKNGKRNGKLLMYKGTPSNMKLVEEKIFVDGQLDGTWKAYNPQNGVLRWEGDYKNGTIVKVKEFDKDKGTILYEELYRDGNLIAEKVYQNGKLKYLYLEDEKGTLTLVREYNLSTGKVLKKNANYKKPKSEKSIKLIEDEWGIVDIA